MLSLSLLGKINLTINGNVPGRTMTAKAIALLSYLIVTRQPHSRHALAGLFWGESSEAKAKTSLRVALSTLRKALPNHIEADRLDVQFREDEPYYCDVVAWEELIQEGKSSEAAALVRGDFMADFYIDGAAAFDEWLVTQRAYWRQKMEDCFTEVANDYLQQRNYENAVRILRRLLTLEPWDEEAHRQLMSALCRLRDFNGALAQYETCRQELSSELGIAPMPATSALYERILHARSADSQNLPADTTPLIGRENELNTLHSHLLNPACRLVTIVGMGGVGKTRLAVALGQRIATENILAFLDGVTFVPLQGISARGNVDAVAQAIALAMDVILPGRQPPGKEITDYLAPEEHLIILDNFEQLRHNAPWLDQLLQRCPGVKLLITSREPLQISAEWRYELAGLAYAAPEDSAAAQLLAQSVLGHGRPFSFDSKCIRQLCQMVEGVPLAIKMVAGWLNTFSCERVLTQLQDNLDLLATTLHDVPSRQRSMRAILDQTWETLTAVEQNALAALSFFRGGFNEEAALQLEACNPFVILQLRERGLVQFDTRNNRLSMHELLRQYAVKKLKNNLDETAHQHAAYFASLIGDESENLLGKTQRHALRRLQPDLDNLRLAWNTLITQRNTDLLAKMLEGWARLLHVESLEQEAIDSLKAAQPLLEAPKHLTTQAHLVRWLAVFYYNQMQLSQSEQSWNHLLQLARQLDDVSLEARALVGLGNVADLQDDYERAASYAEQSLALYKQIGELEEAIRPLNNLGLVHQARGQFDVAIRYYREAIEAGRNSDDEYFIAVPYVNLGFVLTSQGRFKEAHATLETLLDRLNRHDWKRSLPQTYYHLGRVSWYMGAYDRAIRYYLKSRPLFQTADQRARVDRALGRLYALKGKFERARKLAQSALEVHLQDENASSIGIAYSHLGMIESQAGNFQQARHYFEKAITILNDLERVPIFEYAQMAWVCLKIGDIKEASRYLVEGAALVEKISSPRETAWLQTIQAAYQLSQGENKTALTTLHHLLEKSYITADNRSVALHIIQDYEALSNPAG